MLEPVHEPASLADEPARRVAASRFPVVKTLEQFQFNWPRSINRLQVQNLFRLAFIDQNTTSFSSAASASA